MLLAMEERRYRFYKASQGKPRITALYTELMSLKRGKNESDTDSINTSRKVRQGHFINDCPDKAKNETTKCCSHHKSTMHSDSTCRRQGKKQEDTKAKRVAFGK